MINKNSSYWGLKLGLQRDNPLCYPLSHLLFCTNKSDLPTVSSMSVESTEQLSPCLHANSLGNVKFFKNQHLESSTYTRMQTILKNISHQVSAIDFLSMILNWVIFTVLAITLLVNLRIHAGLKINQI